MSKSERKWKKVPMGGWHSCRGVDGIVAEGWKEKLPRTAKTRTNASAAELRRRREMFK